MYRLSPHHLICKGAGSHHWQRITQFPLLELVAVGRLILQVTLAHNEFAIGVLETLQPPLATYVTYLENIANVVLFLLAYRLYCRWVERRKSFEIAWNSGIAETGVGFLGGIVLVAFMVGLFAVFGYYSVSGFSDNQSILIEAFFRFGGGAFIQEFFIRLILFRLVEELIGPWTRMNTHGRINPECHCIHLNRNSSIRRSSDRGFCVHKATVARLGTSLWMELHAGRCLWYA